MKQKRYPTTLVDRDLWERFVNKIGKRKGMKRGAIQKSLEEAIALWIDGDESDWIEGGQNEQ